MSRGNLAKTIRENMDNPGCPKVEQKRRVGYRISLRRKTVSGSLNRKDDSRISDVVSE